MFFLVPIVWAREIETFNIFGPLFLSNNIKTFKNDIWGSFSLRGVWADPNKIASRIMLEEIFCDIDLMRCYSSFSEISFWGGNLSPTLDTAFLTYKIIDLNLPTAKLYCNTTEYTIELNLTTKEVKKYKIFPNGDVNRYLMLFDRDYASKYFETFIP